MEGVVNAGNMATVWSRVIPVANGNTRALLLAWELVLGSAMEAGVVEMDMLGVFWILGPCSEIVISSSAA